MFTFKVNSIEEDFKLEESLKIRGNVEESTEYVQKITNLVITPIEHIVDPSNIESVIEIKEVVESDKPITPNEAFLRSEKQQELLRSTLIAHNNYLDEVETLRMHNRKRSKSHDVTKQSVKDKDQTNKTSPVIIKDLILRHSIDLNLKNKKKQSPDQGKKILCASCSKKLVDDTTEKKKKTGCFKLTKTSK